jgi:hypothetical protein
MLRVNLVTFIIIINNDDDNNNNFLLFKYNWVGTRCEYYTFTHKQYTEYRRRNTHNNYKKK